MTRHLLRHLSRSRRAAALLCWCALLLMSACVPVTAEPPEGDTSMSLPEDARYSPWIEQQREQADAREGGHIVPGPAPIAAPAPTSALPQHDGALGLFVDAATGAPITAQGVLGAPGMYPPVPLHANADGVVKLPALTVRDHGGRPVRLVEVLARTTDPLSKQPRGRWMTVELPASYEPPAAGIAAEEPWARELWKIPLHAADTLAIEAVNPAGEPVLFASVDLMRDRVGLVRLSERTDLKGRAAFEALPEGTYWATIRAQGFVPQTIRVDHRVRDAAERAATPAPVWTASLARGRAVWGRVVDEQGRPVADVDVTAHDAGQLQGAVSLSTAEALPSLRVGTTNAEGFFAIEGLPQGRYVLRAQPQGYVGGASSVVDLSEAQGAPPSVTVRVVEGRTVRVRVVDEEGRPVPRAEVAWLDPSAGTAEGFLVEDASGAITLTGVPPQAQVVARLGEWSSPPYVLGEQDGQGVHQVRATLHAPGALRDWTIRLEPIPEGVVPTRATFAAPGADGRLVECAGSLKGGRDVRFKRCPEGRGWLHVHTQAHGTNTVEAALADGTTLPLPRPSHARVRILGAREAERSAVQLHVTGDAPQAVALKEVEGRRGRALEGQLSRYPGTARLRLDVPGLEPATRSLEIRPADRPAAALEWTIVRPRQVQVLVADRLNAPVTGATVELWDGQRRLATLSSAGHQPVLATIPDTVKRLTITAAHHDIGEGDVVISVTADPRALGTSRDPLVVRLNHPLLTRTAAPGALTDLDEIGRLLGAPIVEDGRQLLVDVTDPASPAARMGIPRGAKLLSVRRTGGKLSVRWDGGEASAP